MISRNFPENFITQRPCTYNLLDYSTVILKLYMHYYYISLVKDKTYLHMYLTQLLCSLFKLKQLADHSVLRCGRLGWMKNFKTPFFKRYWKFLPWGYSYRPRTTPNFFQQIQWLETFKVWAKMGRGWRAVWVMAKIFLLNLRSLMMNKCWKFQEDILIFVWVIA